MLPMAVARFSSGSIAISYMYFRFYGYAIFAHDVLSTRKGRAIKVAPQMAAPEVESAIYDCLVCSAESPLWDKSMSNE